jgi:hypothetical protein
MVSFTMDIRQLLELVERIDNLPRDMSNLIHDRNYGYRHRQVMQASFQVIIAKRDVRLCNGRICVNCYEDGVRECARSHYMGIIHDDDTVHQVTFADYLDTIDGTELFGRERRDSIIHPQPEDSLDRRRRMRGLPVTY